MAEYPYGYFGMPCARLGRMGGFRDLNTGRANQRTCAAVASSGFEAWHADYVQRAHLLTKALERYSNGRMKRFLCELFLQQELPVLQELMCRAEALTGDLKERSTAFRALASAILAAREFQQAETGLLAT